MAVHTGTDMTDMTQSVEPGAGRPVHPDLALQNLDPDFCSGLFFFFFLTFVVFNFYLRLCKCSIAKMSCQDAKISSLFLQKQCLE